MPQLDALCAVAVLQCCLPILFYSSSMALDVRVASGASHVFGQSKFSDSTVRVGFYRQNDFHRSYSKPSLSEISR
jgi:hypothetical protein